ncbi:hypothetical protein FVE85_5793 [Porphyridium purpureum]|uniref:Uncharacterized protein n=1 Tax=Porphyridium purpureum TaxID=35688 RepID=A0A5J4Z4R0_PORPP|nr:hypothetical protein FVE85_5793 [Porphyridium purpureum]|eukprot:POR5151..scf295_1
MTKPQNTCHGTAPSTAVFILCSTSVLLDELPQLSILKRRDHCCAAIVSEGSGLGTRSQKIMNQQGIVTAPVAAAVMSADIGVLNIDSHAWHALNGANGSSCATPLAVPSTPRGGSHAASHGLRALKVAAPSGTSTPVCMQVTAACMREHRLGMTESLQRMHKSLMLVELVAECARREKARAEAARAAAKEANVKHGQRNQTLARENTVIFFDFDDTLLPTTYFEHAVASSVSVPDGIVLDENLIPRRDNSNLRPVVTIESAEEQKERNMLSVLDELIVQVLQDAAQLGQVMIITNAGQGWVEYASAKYLPKLRRYITQSQLEVVSARSKYGAQIPIDAASEWKVCCFKDELTRLVPKLVDVNMLVLGDSISDQYAAHRSFAQLGGSSLLKFVKFSGKPKPSHLVRQLRVLKENLRNLVLHMGSFDVNVTKDS